MDQSKYSNKFIEAGQNLKHRGMFTQEDTLKKGFAHLESKQADIKLYWQIDPDLKTVSATRFFSYGGHTSQAVSETLCLIAENMRVEEAFSLTGSDIESALRNDPDLLSAPAEVFEVVDLLVTDLKGQYRSALALTEAVLVAKPVSSGSTGADVWKDLPSAEKFTRIEAVLEGPIRDFLRMDGGDIEIVDIVNDFEIQAQFHGACGSCSSSSGSTLYNIEHALRQELDERITLVSRDTMSNWV